MSCRPRQRDYIRLQTFRHGFCVHKPRFRVGELAGRYHFFHCRLNLYGRGAGKIYLREHAVVRRAHGRLFLAEKRAGRARGVLPFVPLLIYCRHGIFYTRNGTSFIAVRLVEIFVQSGMLRRYEKRRAASVRFRAVFGYFRILFKILFLQLRTGGEHIGKQRQKTVRSARRAEFPRACSRDI